MIIAIEESRRYSQAHFWSNNNWQNEGVSGPEKMRLDCFGHNIVKNGFLTSTSYFYYLANDYYYLENRGKLSDDDWTQ